MHYNSKTNEVRIFIFIQVGLFFLNLIQQISKIGDWSNDRRVVGSGGGSITFPDDADDDSETLLVVTTVEQPYVMIKGCLKFGIWHRCF